MSRPIHLAFTLLLAAGTLAVAGGAETPEDYVDASGITILRSPAQTP
jgi:hypothetical protein